MRFFVENLQADSGITLVNDNDDRTFIHVDLLPELVMKARKAMRNAKGYAVKGRANGDNLCWVPVEVNGSTFPCNQPKADCGHSHSGVDQSPYVYGEIGLREKAYGQPEAHQKALRSPVDASSGVIEAEPGSEEEEPS